MMVSWALWISILKDGCRRERKTTVKDRDHMHLQAASCSPLGWDKMTRMHKIQIDSEAVQFWNFNKIPFMDHGWNFMDVVGLKMFVIQNVIALNSAVIIRLTERFVQPSLHVNMTRRAELAFQCSLCFWDWDFRLPSRHDKSEIRYFSSRINAA